LGAFIGFLSRFSLYGRIVDESKCNNCLKCAKVCPLAAIYEEGKKTNKSCCQLSFECRNVCPQGAISFGFKPQQIAFNPSRRSFLATTVVTVFSLFFINTSFSRKYKNVILIRPPGAKKEEKFFSLCSRCGQCMKVCPTNVIQPAFLAAGLEGILTPQLIFKHAYCEWNCNECGKVCPTGAIDFLSLEKKHKTIIGTAYINKNKCLPYADFKNCIVCQELCPTPEKAIILKEEYAVTPKGKKILLKRPIVLKEKCIGCGICEYNCPVSGAIQVAS